MITTNTDYAVAIVVIDKVLDSTRPERSTADICFIEAELVYTPYGVLKLDLKKADVEELYDTVDYYRRKEVEISLTAYTRYASYELPSAKDRFPYR